MAQIIPQLSARDVDAYVSFLSEAFGFGVTEYWRDPGDENHVNIELSLDGAVVGVGRASGERTARGSAAPHIGLYVIVDDVDAHYERAQAAGADVRGEPEDRPYGDRVYHAIDPEGHDWFFATRVKDVAPEEWGAVVAS